jgi:LysR family transcriptional activator of mexEF-oprN operon
MISAGFDLNLLRVFATLLDERSVTRAGERLGRTQSAVSNSLARLREALDDPLFVRGSGGLVPTDRARALEPQVREILRLAAACLIGSRAFDPADAEGLFRIGAPDRLSLPLMLPVIRTIRRAAPGLAIDVVTADRDRALELIDSDRIDLAIGWFDRPPPRFRATFAFRDELVCLTRADHPLRRRGGATDIEALLGYPHLVVSGAGDRKAGFDDMLAQGGRKRTAAVSVTNFTAVPELLIDSDLVGVFTSGIAGLLASRPGLATTPLPMEVGALDHYLVWHGRSETDARHAWFRDRVLEACRGGAPVS